MCKTLYEGLVWSVVDDQLQFCSVDLTDWIKTL